jgi:hypothetical protein
MLPQWTVCSVLGTDAIAFSESALLVTNFHVAAFFNNIRNAYLAALVYTRAATFRAALFPPNGF